MPVIEIRKLAAVDMVWLGQRIVVGEYALGVLLPFALGLWSIRVGWQAHGIWQAVVGAWLMSISANYVPLFLYASSIMRAGTVEREGRAELARAKRYGVQQTMILVPFMVVSVALVQEWRRNRQTPRQ
jgi:hypothetical protein